MRTLYLLRHAKSSWDDPGLADHDRPLAPRGRSDAPAMGAYMREAGLQPDVVLCSSARRTRETLELLGGAIPADCEVHVEDGLYGAGAATLLNRLQALHKSAHRALLIGHNPGLQELAVRLATPGEVTSRMRHKFPTAALAILEAAVADWPDLGPGRAEVADFVRPKDLSS